MDNIHQFNNRQEQFLIEALKGIDELKAGFERGDLTSYFTVAYSKEHGSVIFYSKPENMSYYHILGQVDVAQQYIRDIVIGMVE